MGWVDRLYAGQFLVEEKYGKHIRDEQRREDAQFDAARKAAQQRAHIR